MFDTDVVAMLIYNAAAKIFRRADTPEQAEQFVRQTFEVALADLRMNGPESLIMLTTSRKSSARPNQRKQTMTDIIFVLLATFDPDPDPIPNEIWAFSRQAEAENFLRGWSEDFLGGYSHDVNDLPP